MLRVPPRYTPHVAVPARTQATYDDVVAAPAGNVAELVAGVLHTQPRPGGPPAAAGSGLGDALGPRVERGRGGPGGWILLDEPEIHFGDDVLVPDLAGWRRERMSAVPDAPYLTIVPDWVCEIVSKSTAKLDRSEKLPIYAAHAVAHAWLVDPALRTLEAFRLEHGRWSLLSVHADAAHVRVEPFEAFELDLAILWADVAAG